MRDVMSDNSKPSQDEPKAATVSASKSTDFRDRKRTANKSLTLREYKELSAKDRLTLTPGEQKRLDEDYTDIPRRYCN